MHIVEIMISFIASNPSGCITSGSLESDCHRNTSSHEEIVILYDIAMPWPPRPAICTQSKISDGSPQCTTHATFGISIPPERRGFRWLETLKNAGRQLRCHPGT